MNGQGPQSPPSTGPRAGIERLSDRFVPQRLQPWREQIHYLVMGGWNTVFGYALFAALYALAHGRLPVTVILVMSYVVGVTNNYMVYRIVVFRSHAKVWRELPRFSVIYVVALAANLVALPLALHTLPLNAYILQAAFMTIVVGITYLANKYFGFRRPAAADASE